MAGGARGKRVYALLVFEQCVDIKLKHLLWIVSREKKAESDGLHYHDYLQARLHNARKERQTLLANRRFSSRTFC